uniref:fimbrial protein n=1 Tax=Serratia TaxID=613 RepID=UPI001F4C4554|nr:MULTISPECIES: fimbrial protein [Serratia]ULG12124.1 exotoxin [Serratia entomophila]ULG12321.1 exotoxin [Serratia entomophila]ULG12357.1 exotoxin [Serratia entomophila]ULG15951.1 exotoxin [Serratia proteamaculans]ULG18451.1 exotoxin [Serratia proteamaculans]
MKKILATVCLFGFGLSSMLPTYASVSVDVTVVVLAQPPCVINNDQPIDVNFQDVMTSMVDGVGYQMPIPYTLICTGLASNDLRMMIQGTPTTFDDTAIQVTDRSNMGIRIINNGTPQQVGEWFDFTYSSPTSKPGLYVVPVKQSGSTLTEGSFTATGSMVVEYQ